MKRQYELLGFTPAREREARRLILADKTLRGLLQGKRYELGGVVPVASGGLIGGAADVDVMPAIAATAVLPYVCKGDPKVGEGRYQVRMRDVTRLNVLAHFTSDRVVEISPRSGRLSAMSKVLPGSDRCPPSQD